MRPFILSFFSALFIGYAKRREFNKHDVFYLSFFSALFIGYAKRRELNKHELFNFFILFGPFYWVREEERV